MSVKHNWSGGQPVATSDLNNNFQTVMEQKAIDGDLTLGEAIDGSGTPQVVAVKTSDGLAYKADANDTSLVNAIGFVVSNELISATPYIVTEGLIGGFTGLTIGAQYYVQDTAGTIGTTPSSTTIIPIGIAFSATQLFVKIGKKKAIVAAGDVSRTTAGTTATIYTIGFRASRIKIKATAAGNSYSRSGWIDYYLTTPVNGLAIGDDGDGNVENAEVAINPTSIVGVQTPANYSYIGVSIGSIDETSVTFNYTYGCADAGCGTSRAVSGQTIIFEE